MSYLQIRHVKERTCLCFSNKTQENAAALRKKKKKKVVSQPLTTLPVGRSRVMGSTTSGGWGFTGEWNVCVLCVHENKLKEK